jgi:hypothetical protein
MEESYVNNPDDYDFAFFAVRKISTPSVEREAIRMTKGRENKGELLLAWIGKKIDDAIREEAQKIYSNEGMAGKIFKKAKLLSRNIYFRKRSDKSLVKLADMIDYTSILLATNKEFIQTLEQKGYD